MVRFDSIVFYCGLDKNHKQLERKETDLDLNACGVSLLQQPNFNPAPFSLPKVFFPFSAFSLSVHYILSQHNGYPCAHDRYLYAPSISLCVRITSLI